MAELQITCPEDADTEAGASKTGAFHLSWTGPEGASYRLVETAGGEDTTVYDGPQLGSSITGRTEGDYAYAVGLVEEGEVSSWSEPCTVLVRPYPLSLALMFFVFGLTVAAATVALVVRGHRAHRRGELG